MENLPNELVNHALEWASKMSTSIGISPIAGQLYTILYLSPSSLSLDEMATACAVSKGSVSTNIRALERWGAVKKVWIRGDRKDHYECNPDILKIIVRQLGGGLANRLEQTNQFLEELNCKLSRSNLSIDTKSKIDTRLKSARKSTQKISKGIRLLRRFGIGKN